MAFRNAKKTARLTGKKSASILGLVVATTLLAACQGGGVNNNSNASAPAEGNAGQPAVQGGDNLTIDFIVGASNDSFFSTVKRGADDAAKAIEASGGKVRWLPVQNYDNFGPDLGKLLQSSVSSKPAAVVSIDPVPDAQNQLLKQISSGGTPVVLMNSGLSEVKAVGAMGFVGSDEGQAGKLTGETLAKQGVKHVLCVNPFPGTSFAQARCSGLQDGIATGGGTSTELPLPSTNFGNQTAVAQAIKAALLNDSSIDGVVTIDLSSADAASSALQQASVTDKVKFASFDVNSAQLDRIKGGTMLFAVDQQPYMQGYYALSMAYQYAKFGVKMPDAQKTLLTGPTLVTKDNVDVAIAGAKAGAR